MGEIGKNITLYEYEGEMLLVDCGMTFPDEETPGVDSIIPDFTYVLENKDKIKDTFIKSWPSVPNLERALEFATKAKAINPNNPDLDIIIENITYNIESNNF